MTKPMPESRDSARADRGRNREEGKPVRFLWSDSRDDYLVALRSEFRLAELVAQEQCALVKVITICRWVHGLWEHSGRSEAIADDPIAILREALTGKAFRCVEYATVLQGCLTAIGIKARVIALKKKDVETATAEAGHVANEVYLPDPQRWVFVDAQFDFIASTDGNVLNAVELRDALKLGRPVRDLGKREDPVEAYLHWLAPYLFYLDVRLDNRVAAPNRSPTSLMLVPVGAKTPRIMQRRWLIEDMLYSHDVQAFYPLADQEAQGSPKLAGGGDW